MAAFVLVHGSGQNAGCWARVAEALAQAGHAVAMPELPKREPGWRLEDHAAHIARSIQGDGAVVAAHSLSGAFLPLVPQVRPCALLVFVAAVVPEPGKSIREQFTADAAMFHPAWIAAGPRWSDAAQREALAREFLFHDCDAEALAWSLGTLEPYDTSELVLQRSPEAPLRTRAVSIVASEDRTLTADWCRRAARRAGQREVAEIGAGHCPQNSRPAALAALLAGLAVRHAAAGARKR